MIKVLLFFIALGAFPLQAHASYWLECKVDVLVEDHNKTPGGYSVKIMDAVVTEGHQDKGKPCLEDLFGKSIDIKSEESLTLNEHADMKYVYHNSMGPDGMVESTIWTKWGAVEKKMDTSLIDQTFQNMEGAK